MNKEKLDFYIECKDFTVSGEKFKLYEDKDLDMLITLPKPGVENLGKYYESDDYISHTDSKRSFFEKLYHLVKKYSLNKKVKLISSLNQGSGTLLDIGGGTGDFLVQARLKGWQVKGVEPNEQAREIARKKKIILEPDTTDLPSHNYDVVTMWHVLEHVPDLEIQVKELKRLVKPGGYIIIAVPNFRSFDAGYYKSFWAAYDVPRHLWHFSKTSIEKLFAKENINLKKIVPLVFDSFYVALLSEKYKNGAMNYFRAVWIGFLSNVKAKGSKEYSSHIYILKNG
ncbi:class I SAM-dependent methyltransferase [Aquimarina sp. AD1]|uniref:class I SAM-dependent methyltransferase n=1 Tax=Aquimarina sp. (strain AD1) TaxID=1714848 RepID=UPI000E5203A7|nr:class I SAM-dependent methyltransferase [Aquimarina sp. AD1]AXT57306.1 class I SAM-dependent methyltransferase [Aquimarina sp. AD1]RKN12262.1 methyltransferase domain-containing protein [Aquimarina sp. AD1]